MLFEMIMYLFQGFSRFQIISEFVIIFDYMYLFNMCMYFYMFFITSDSSLLNHIHVITSTAMRMLSIPIKVHTMYICMDMFSC